MSTIMLNILNSEVKLYLYVLPTQDNIDWKAKNMKYFQLIFSILIMLPDWKKLLLLVYNQLLLLNFSIQFKSRVTNILIKT